MKKRPLNWQLREVKVAKITKEVTEASDVRIVMDAIDEMGVMDAMVAGHHIMAHHSQTWSSAISQGDDHLIQTHFID